MHQKDYKKKLMFFNSQRDNVAVRLGSTSLLDSIRTNKVIYVARLARLFDLEESARYDALTDEQLVRGFEVEEVQVPSGIHFHASETLFDREA